MACECGAKKVYNARDGGSEHSGWCPVSPGNNRPQASLKEIPIKIQIPNYVSPSIGIGIYGGAKTGFNAVPGGVGPVHTAWGPMPPVHCTGYCAHGATLATKVFKMAGGNPQGACDSCLKVMTVWGIIQSSWDYGDPTAPKVP